jgi:hypothetical protein
MNYIFILKEEKTETIHKFNKIKKWFISNLYSNIGDKILYIYENDIDMSASYFLHFYMIAPNVFPMLNSCLLENALKQKNSICEDHIHTIIYLQIKELIKIENENTTINFIDFYKILKFLPSRTYGLIQEYHIKNMHNRKWFYVEDNKIPNFLDDMINKYFTWENMNHVKLIIAYRYPKIIYYDGKNKYESKKMVEKWNIQTPKTYKQFQSLKDITQEEINKLPMCIIKPTNWDGGKYIFKNDIKCPLSASQIRNDLHKFDSDNIHKEIMALISKTHKPSIIAEEYIKDLSSNYSSPCEFKFYIFQGKILFILATNRKVSKKKFNFFDENFCKLPITLYSFSRNELKFQWKKPSYFDKLKEDVYKIYDIFDKDMKNTFIGKFIRIDFFINKEDYWFGEFSLFPNGGRGDNLNDYGKKAFIKNWIPEIFEILGE